MTEQGMAYLSIPAWDYRVLARLAAREKARSAEDEARERGWRIEWSDPTEYSWRVVVLDKDGRELAREENVKPRWWEAQGAGEHRMAEMESRAVSSALEGVR